VLVRPNLRSRIVDLHDVQVTTPSDGQVLRYDSGVWENDTLTAGDVGAIPTTEKGAANGVASLNSGSLVNEYLSEYPPYIKSIHYYNSRDVDSSNLPLNNDRTWIYPVDFHMPIAVDQIGMQMTAGAGLTQQVRVALYSFNTTTGFITFVRELATYDATITTLQMATVDETFPRGITFFGARIFNSTAPNGSLRGYKLASPYIGTQNATGAITTGSYAAFGTGVWSDVSSVALTGSTQAIQPFMVFRIKP
jgi:hypothetical protein